MTSNIQFVSEFAASIPVASAPGKVRLFRDVGDGLLKFKDNVGAVYPIAGTQDYKDAVRFASVAVLPAYTRVGNTITASANGALPAQDGVTPALNDAFLYVSGVGATEKDNGIYVVTQLGNVSNPFILDRRGDFAASSQVSPGLVVPTGPEGASNGSKLFILATAAPITLNSTAITFEAISGGGGFTLTDIDASVVVPDKQSMLYADDVLVDDGGDLSVEGDVSPVREEDNFSVNFVPQRSTRVVQENDQMLFTDSMQVDGDLVVDGDILDATPYDGNDILAALTAIAPGTPAILGVASPAHFMLPLEARTVLDVPSVPEMTAAIAAGGGGGGPTWVAGVQSTSFSALAGNAYVWEAGATLTATLPAAPADNDKIFFTGDPTISGEGGALTLDAGSNTILFGAGPNTIPVSGHLVFTPFELQFRQSGGLGLGFWALSKADLLALEISNNANSLPISTNTGSLSLATIADNSVLGRTPGSDPTSIAVGTNSVLGRLGADLVSIPISSIGSGITQDPVVKTANFTASVNTAYYVEGWPSGDKQVQLPASPAVGDRVLILGLDAAGLAQLTVWSSTDAIEVGTDNGGAGLSNGPTVNCRGAHLDLLYCTVSGSTRWRDTGNGANTFFTAASLASVPNAVATSNSVGFPTPVPVPAQSLVVRAAGNLTTATIPSGNFVGRPNGGDLGAMSPTQALTSLFPNRTFVNTVVTTTDATTSAIYSFTVTSSKVFSMELTFMGTDTGSDNVMTAKVMATFGKTGGVPATRSVLFVDLYKDDAAWGSPSFDPSPVTDIIVQVTGKAATTIHWRVVGVILEHV